MTRKYGVFEMHVPSKLLECKHSSSLLQLWLFHLVFRISFQEQTAESPPNECLDFYQKTLLSAKIIQWSLSQTAED